MRLVLNKNMVIKAEWFFVLSVVCVMCAVDKNNLHLATPTYDKNITAPEFISNALSAKSHCADHCYSLSFE